MASNNGPSTGTVFLHFVAGLCTGGLWWAWLAIRFILSVIK